MIAESREVSILISAIHIDAQGKHTWTFDYSLP
jgi:hypothetical protein